MSGRGVVCVACLVAAIGLSQPAAAQTSSPAPPQNPSATPAGNQQNQQNPKSAAGKDADKPAPDEAGEVPEDLLKRILAGDADAVTEMRNFLLGKDRKPEGVARRATQLINQIGKLKSKVGTETLLKVVDRVASNAINMVAGSQIINLGVDKDFKPTNALVAWDFGPPDGNVSPGFERISPGDARIAGGKVDGLRRPSDSDLLNDGLAGVERIEADVPDGNYRIILMTQNLGDRKLMASPFGSEVVVNGNALAVTQPSSDQWAGESILSNRGLQAASGDAKTVDGFVTGDLGSTGQELSRSQQGGAIIVPATARNGKLIIELRGLQNSRSYLTGLMVEPADKTSDLVMSHEAMDTLMPPELRLALEENILTAAANVLAELAPAEGESDLGQLPEPILNPEENASISS